MDGHDGRRVAAIAVGAIVVLGAIGVPAWAAIVPEHDPDEAARAIVHDQATLDAATTGWHELARVTIKVKHKKGRT